MNRARALIWTGIVFAALGVSACSAAVDVSGELARARQAFQQNLTVGDSLAGKPATAAQVTAVEQSFEEALLLARGAVQDDAQSVEAHRLAGLLLCTAYRPAVIERNDDGTPKTTVVLPGAAKDCEEGLAELRAALRLAKSPPDLRMDYAQAMKTCGDMAGAEAELTSLWEAHQTLSTPQALRCAHELADIARDSHAAEVELRWLREALKLDPNDPVAGPRLVAMVPTTAMTVTWVSYESGLTSAANTGKLILIDFSAEWCGWCKRLEQEVFPTPAFTTVAQQFVCIKVDSDTRRDLTTHYGVDRYPTAIVLDSAGNELDRLVGYASARDYVMRLRRLLISN